jgi:hypothetical protein
MRGIANVTLMALLTAVAGCTRPVAIEGKEVAQEIDFYAELKALATKDSAGAHKTDVYRVYVAPTAHDEGAEEVLRTNSRDGVAMDWVDKDTLKLTIPCGRVFAFRNFFEITNAGGELERRISIRLNAEGPLTCL